jgi:hypothetical protein
MGALAGQALIHLELDGGQVLGEERLFAGEIGRIRDVRPGPDGYLYLVTDDPEGGLYRAVPAFEHVVEAAEPSSVPLDLEPAFDPPADAG